MASAGEQPLPASLVGDVPVQEVYFILLDEFDGWRERVSPGLSSGYGLCEFRGSNPIDGVRYYHLHSLLGGSSVLDVGDGNCFQYYFRHEDSPLEGSPTAGFRCAAYALKNGSTPLSGRGCRATLESDHSLHDSLHPPVTMADGLTSGASLQSLLAGLCCASS